MIPQRTKRKTVRIEIIISIFFHTCMILAVVYLAARGGVLGKTLKNLTLTREEKMPEKKKLEPVKPPEAPKVVENKSVEAPRTVAMAAPVQQRETAPPPTDAPTVAPATTIGANFDFHEGAKDVRVGDPISVYKNMVENALRSRWDRPEDMEDDAFQAEVEVKVDASGKLGGYTWVKGSGNARWDDSVKTALNRTKSISKGPPKGFPSSFRVVFDVESMRTEDALQLSAR